LKYLQILFIALTLNSCKPNSFIPISNNLEIALNQKGDYNNYISLLNKSVQNDSSALNKFFKINYIYDAAGYDHGFILFQLLKNIGDKNFASNLKKLDKTELINVINYIEVGIDGNEERKKEIKDKFPETANLLKME
jgi:hypothetical protein